ncbi:MAG: hypothetical protein AAGA45_04950, partial [Verrucomicrobiota bacterium]
MTQAPANQHYDQLVNEGLKRVEETHQLLVGLLADLLKRRGATPAAELILALVEDHTPPVQKTLERDSVQALSYAFQLLNLAEEHLA